MLYNLILLHPTRSVTHQYFLQWRLIHNRYVLNFSIISILLWELRELRIRKKTDLTDFSLMAWHYIECSEMKSFINLKQNWIIMLKPRMDKDQDFSHTGLISNGLWEFGCVGVFESLNFWISDFWFRVLFLTIMNVLCIIIYCNSLLGLIKT